MHEDLLTFIWKHKIFNTSQLKTTDGRSVQIQFVGEHNFNAGPDFLNARIMIDNTLWAGHVEMHVKTSDWNLHGHSKDKAYNNVILHVVFQDDKPIENLDLPVLNLTSYISYQTIDSYLKLKNNQLWIACEEDLPQIPTLTLDIWLERLLIERLERKTEQIKDILQKLGSDWSETAYRLLARCFGFHINAMPMERLSEVLPLKILLKHAGNLHQLEALLFGQAGMLNENFEDEYPLALKKEYEFLSQKYTLDHTFPPLWKYLRLRPDNFPVIRIAQFASLMQYSDRFFSKILEISNASEAYNFLEVSASQYWNTHYRFDKVSTNNTIKNLGKGSKNLLITNAIVPLLFAYGTLKNQEKYRDIALQILEKLPPEKNSVTQNWERLGISNKSAHRSQALIQLKNEYCNHKKCLECAVGAKILKPKAV